jgi:hypothetical protein
MPETLIPDLDALRIRNPAPTDDQIQTIVVAEKRSTSL